MVLSDKQKNMLNEMEKTQDFRRQRRIHHKMVSKNRVDYVGKGFYYYIEHSRPEDRIMDIITSEIEVKNGGYIRQLHHWKKGNKCNLELLNNYQTFNQSAIELGVSINDHSIGVDFDYNNRVDNSYLINDKGETNCDIVVLQIGGTNNGFCCREPSSVNGEIIIRTITERKLNELINLENKENRSGCLMM